MRILMVTHDVPVEPLGGLALYVAGVARQLARRHGVCVVGYRWPGQDGPPPPGVEVIAREPPSYGDTLVTRARGRLRATVTLTPREVPVVTPPLRAATASLLAERDFDLLHVTPSQLAEVAHVAPHLPKVLSAVDHLPNIVRGDGRGRLGPRLRAAVEERAVERYERRAFLPYSSVVYVTESDAAAARAVNPGVPAVAIPNGVDVERFRPPPDGAERDAATLLFTGVLSYRPNVDAAVHLVEEVLPRVARTHPGVRVALVGRDPDPAVLALASDRVRVTGAVPEVVPWLQSATVFTCPMLSGTGIKNKLLEAMACGAPAVATGLATRGLDVLDGEHLLVADGPDAFAAAVVRLLDDRALGAALARAAREHVAEEHSWEACARAHERVYERALAAARRSGVQPAGVGA